MQFLICMRSTCHCFIKAKCLCTSISRCFLSGSACYNVITNIERRSDHGLRDQQQMHSLRSMRSMKTGNPVSKPKGRGMAIAAIIIGVISWILGIVSFWFVFWFAYGRMNTAVILTSSASLLLALTAILSITLSIIAKVRGAHTGMLVGALIPSILTFPSVALNAYILIYYIGMTY